LKGRAGPAILDVSPGISMRLAICLGRPGSMSCQARSVEAGPQDRDRSSRAMSARQEAPRSLARPRTAGSPTARCARPCRPRQQANTPPGDGKIGLAAAGGRSQGEHHVAARAVPRGYSQLGPGPKRDIDGALGRVRMVPSSSAHVGATGPAGRRRTRRQSNVPHVLGTVEGRASASHRGLVSVLWADGDIVGPRR